MAEFGRYRAEAASQHPADQDTTLEGKPHVDLLKSRQAVYQKTVAVCRFFKHFHILRLGCDERVSSVGLRC